MNKIICFFVITCVVFGGVVFADQEEILLVYTGKAQQERSFELTDIADIEYLQLVVDAGSTPKGFNKFADGNNGLTIFLNWKLPYEGEFGIPDVLENAIRQQPSQIKEVVSKSLWYFPESFANALGQKGRRSIKFDKSAVKEGKNTLIFKSSDANSKPGEGDGIQMSGFWVYVKRINQELQALGEVAAVQVAEKKEQKATAVITEDRIAAQENLSELEKANLPISQRTFQIGMPNIFVIKDITGKQYEDLVRKVKEINEVLLVSTDRIPWADFTKGPDVKSALYDASFTHAKLIKMSLGFSDLYIALSPLNTARDDVGDLPSGFRRSFADTNLRESYKNLIVRIARDLKPKYFSLGVEMSAYYHKQPEDFDNFVSLYKEAYSLIKKESPDTLVFVTFHFEEFLGLLSWNKHSPDWSVFNKFLPEIDAFAISTYPYMVYDLGDLPVDYYTQIRKHTDLPIIIAESGWSTSTDGKTIKNLHGSLQKQKEFLLMMTKVVSDLKCPLWIYWSIMDYDPATYPDLFNAIGLTDLKNCPKPAWYIWRKIFDIPLIESNKR